MKRNFVITLIISLSVLTGLTSFAQTGCVDYHKKSCQRIAGSGYAISPDSRSALFMKGQTSEFKVDIYQGKDYKITLCNDENLGSNVQLDIIDTETNEVLYTNKDKSYAKEYAFTVLQSRQIKIVISVPDDEKKVQSNNSFRTKTLNEGCLGVLIEEMVTPKRGF